MNLKVLIISFFFLYFNLTDAFGIYHGQRWGNERSTRAAKEEGDAKESSVESNAYGIVNYINENGVDDHRKTGGTIICPVSGAGSPNGASNLRMGLNWVDILVICWIFLEVIRRGICLYRYYKNKQQNDAMEKQKIKEEELKAMMKIVMDSYPPKGLYPKVPNEATMEFRSTDNIKF